MKILTFAVLMIAIIFCACCTKEQTDPPAPESIEVDSVWLDPNDTTGHIILKDSMVTLKIKVRDTNVYGPDRAAMDTMVVVQWAFVCKLPEPYVLKQMGNLYYVESTVTKWTFKEFASMDSCNTMRQFNRWLESEHVRVWRSKIQIGNDKN